MGKPQYRKGLANNGGNGKSHLKWPLHVRADSNQYCEWLLLQDPTLPIPCPLPCQVSEWIVAARNVIDDVHLVGKPQYRKGLANKGGSGKSHLKWPLHVHADSNQYCKWLLSQDLTLPIPISTLPCNRLQGIEKTNT